MKNRAFTFLCIVAFALPFLLLPIPARSAFGAYERGCVEDIVNEQSVERCGLGYWRTLCGWNAGVEECETFFELIEEDTPQPKISNVLFLPGIKGSRLYRPDPLCEGSVAECAVTLWEPYGNDRSKQLFLNEDGKGVHEDVYARAGDVLSAAFGQRFYASFITDLNERMISGTFGSGWRWEAGAYDWRLSLEDLVTRGAREDDRIYFGRTSDAPYLETQLRDLAANSPTGKVTIIAHSNGGLVAKALIVTLGAEASALVDSMIFVGVPHLGAPQALGALLFGHGEALPFDACAVARAVSTLCGLLMDRSTARSFAEHAPMAYHLLPSRAYFETMSARIGNATSAPVATFNGAELYGAEQAVYGNEIDSESELTSYATAREGGRLRPTSSDTAKPAILSPSLLSYARHLHDSLDSWRAPAGINVHHIIGWGKETISGIEFYEEPSVISLFGKAIPRYRPLLFFEGDGVVPSLSAYNKDRESLDPIPVSLDESVSNGTSISSEHRYWVNLRAINAERIGGGFSHGTLFEIDSVRQLLTNLIDDVVGSEVSLPPHITSAKPAIAAERSWIRIFLHSPLTLELYSGDKHLGVTPNGEFVNEIPGATYDEFGEVKYISAPGGVPYTVVMRGYGSGSFSVDIQEILGAEKTTSTIANVPVTPELIATMELPAESPAQTMLSLDHDGDGSVDETIALAVGETTPYVKNDAEGAESTTSPSEPNRQDQRVKEVEVQSPNETIESTPLPREQTLTAHSENPFIADTKNTDSTSLPASSTPHTDSVNDGGIPEQASGESMQSETSLSMHTIGILLLLTLLALGLLFWRGMTQRGRRSAKNRP